MIFYVSALAVVLLLAGTIAVYLWRSHRPTGVRASPPPIVFLPPPGAAPPIVRPPAPAPEPVREPAVDPAAAPPAPRPAAPVAARPHLVARDSEFASAGDAAAAAHLDGPDSEALPQRTAAWRRPARPRAAGELALAVPPNSTLRMLPGRLEAVDGRGLIDDIRFVAVGGAGPQSFTVGRGDGPLHQHIRLDSPTVSRQHAALTFENNGWSISNLSDTNPVRLNGAEVPPDEAIRLADGDVVELGEIMLRFRA